MAVDIFVFKRSGAIDKQKLAGPDTLQYPWWYLSIQTSTPVSSTT
jgi:hypothetical protein